MLSIYKTVCNRVVLSSLIGFAIVLQSAAAAESTALERNTWVIAQNNAITNMPNTMPIPPALNPAVRNTPNAGAVMAMPPAMALDTPSPVCNVVSAVGGTIQYDFGTNVIPAIPAPAQNATWTVSCSSPTTLGFTIQDKREGSQTNLARTAFGLGNQVNGGARLGYVTLLPLSLSVDGLGATMLYQTSAGSAWYKLNGVFDKDHSQYAWGTTTVPYKPMVGAQFAMVVAVQPHFGTREQMGGVIRDIARLDANLVVVFNYGV